MYSNLAVRPQGVVFGWHWWFHLPIVPRHYRPRKTPHLQPQKKKKFPVRFDIFILDNTENQTLPYLYQCMPHNGGSHKLRQ